jgi:hypothetical protein
MNCPSCHRKIAAGDNKCSRCGVKIDLKYCPNGHVMEPNATVCKYCPPGTGVQSAKIDATYIISDLNPIPPAPKASPLSVENEFKTKLLSEGLQQKQKDEVEHLIGWLVVVDGKEHWKDFRICKTKTIIGRSKNCDIIIDDEYVSTKHATLRLIEGDFVITDLDSSNGTFVNDKEVAQASLHDGEVIKMGKTSLKMKIL